MLLATLSKTHFQILTMGGPHLALAVILALSGSHIFTGLHAEEVTEYCENEIFQARCDQNEVVLMTSAKYGRMKLGRCITQSYGHLGCNVDVMEVVDGFCSGKLSCELGANDRSLLDKKVESCPKDMAAYLVASYDCLKVEEGCQASGNDILDGDSGFISSSTSGSHQCTWQIRPPQGRQVNITIYSFPPLPQSDGVASSACYEVGSLTENEAKQTLHKCLNDPRHKKVYLSKGGQVDVVLSSSHSGKVAGNFLLQYQVMGCSDPNIPENVHLKREENKAVVKCKNTEQEWELRCVQGEWQGSVDKCTEVANDSKWTFLGLFGDDHPYGTAIVVGIGATLGVLIGGILLYIIIAIFKRCQKSDYVMTYEYTDPSFAHIPTDYHADKSNLLLQDDKLFEQNSNTWGSQSHGNSNTLSRGGTDHSRVPLPPLPNENNTLSYEKPLYPNRNGNV